MVLKTDLYQKIIVSRRFTTSTNDLNKMLYFPFQILLHTALITYVINKCMAISINILLFLLS